MGGFTGGPASYSTILNRDDVRDLFRGNFAAEIGQGISSCKYPTFRTFLLELYIFIVQVALL